MTAILLAILLSGTPTETELAPAVARALGVEPVVGKTIERVLWDKTRCDIIIPDAYAVELDWAKTGKWAEAIGQSLYYAELTGLDPGIVLLVRDDAKDARYVYRCQTVCARYGIRLWVMRVADLRTDDE